MVSASSRALTARSQVLSSSEAGQHTRAHAQKKTRLPVCLWYICMLPCTTSGGGEQLCAHVSANWNTIFRNVCSANVFFRFCKNRQRTGKHEMRTVLEQSSVAKQTTIKPPKADQTSRHVQYNGILYTRVFRFDAHHCGARELVLFAYCI